MIHAPLRTHDPQNISYESQMMKQYNIGLLWVTLLRVPKFSNFVTISWIFVRLLINMFSHLCGAGFDLFVTKRRKTRVSCLYCYVRSLNELRVLLLESPRHSPSLDRDLSREVHKAEWRVKETKLQDDIKTLRDKLLLLVRLGLLGEVNHCRATDNLCLSCLILLCVNQLSCSSHTDESWRVFYLLWLVFGFLYTEKVICSTLS